MILYSTLGELHESRNEYLYYYNDKGKKRNTDESCHKG